MPQLKLALLGRFQARRGGKEISLPTRKTRLLLAYLALPPGEPRARETLIGLLWSDRNEEQARGSLRNALSALRKSLGSDALKVEEDTVALAPEAVETDVDRFERLAKDGTAEALAAAGVMYRGDFLKGTSLPEPSFQDWLSFEQTRLRELACRVLFDLIDHRIAAGDKREALDIARRLLSIDPLDEEVHRILMRLYSETNQRAQALRQYDTCARMLEQELGVEPAEETTALRDSIRTCAPKRSPAAEPVVAAAPAVKEQAAPEKSKTSPSPSVAVLPFTNMGGDPAQEYFVDGITDDIITALCRFRWLAVMSRNSSFAFKGKPTDVNEIARQLGARYIAYGSVRQGGGRLRINAQLIDAEDDKNLWAERYDRNTEDVLTLQDDIADTIAAAIAPELEGAESRRAGRKPPENLDAWDLYQRGRWHLHRPEDESNTEAQRLFRQAIESDPGFAAAHTGLAIVDYFSVMFGLTNAPTERLAEAEAAAQQALALDDKDAFAHSVLGQIYFMQRQFDMGFPEVRTGVALNPHSARVRFALGWTHTFAGETEEALLSLEKAAQLSPHDPSIWAFMSMRAIAHIVREEYEAAADWARRSARRPNARFWANANLAAALGHLGRDQDARDAVKKIFAMKPNFSLAFVASTLPFKEAEHRERYLEGLRRAGVDDEQKKTQHPGATPAAEEIAATGRPDLSPELSILVLPFENLSGDPKQAYFVGGITEDMCSALIRFRWLRVISRSPPFAQERQPADPAKIASDLGVRYVVAGSVRQGGDRLRISARLIDAENGDQVWAQRYDQELAQVLGLQDDIAETIAATIAPELEEAELQRARRAPAGNLDAWDLYQRGRWHLYRFRKADNAEARRLFQEAMERDPGFGPVHSAFAYGCHLAVIEGFAPAPAEALAEGISAARQAITLDDRDAFAHSVMGQLLVMDRQYKPGLAEVEAAADLNPYLARAWYGLGWVRTFAGMPDRAVPAFEKAVRLSPHDPNLWSVLTMRSFAHILERDFDDAVHWAHQALQRPNALFWPYTTLASALGNLGRAKEAREAIDGLRQLKPGFSLAFVADTLPFKEAEHLERYLEGLRRAGMSDEPAAAPRPSTTGHQDKAQHPGAAPVDPPPAVAKGARTQPAAAAAPGVPGTVTLSQPNQEIRFCTSADGARIAYAAVGRGPPLVKTANWLNHLEYDWQGPVWRHLFAELTRDHTLIRYDARGNGLSDWDVDDISFEGFVTDLETLVDTLELERFPLLAVSQGCAVAVAYAVRHPERVSHLVLHGGFCRGWRMRGSTDEIRRRESLVTLIQQGWEQDSPDFQQVFSSMYLPDSTPEQALWWSELLRITTSRENFLLLQDALGTIDVSPLLAHVAAPTLVTHAIRDSAVLVEEGRRLANEIPGACFVPLESRNHLIMEHESAWPRFVSEIKGFLNTG